MPVTHGGSVDYSDYRAHFTPRSGRAVHWSWRALQTMLDATAPGERGSLTLTSGEGVRGCEFLPGLSLNLQVVPGQGNTRSHAHAWWHLFHVRSGQALVVLDEGSQVLAPGDLLLVPAWVSHRFENSHDSPLVLQSLSNLPQQHALANHRAIEPDAAPLTTNQSS